MRRLATEFGLTVPQGVDKLKDLAVLVEADELFPAQALRVVRESLEHGNILTESIKTWWHHQDGQPGDIQVAGSRSHVNGFLG
jgi:hypothetical protein